jgi:hypothetical protein
VSGGNAETGLNAMMAGIFFFFKAPVRDRAAGQSFMV